MLHETALRREMTPDIGSAGQSTCTQASRRATTAQKLGMIPRLDTQAMVARTVFRENAFYLPKKQKGYKPKRVTF